MTSAFSQRSADIEPFRVMALLERANALQAAGHDVIHLEIGEPDFATAEPIQAAAQRALAQGRLPYTAAAGLPALREALAEHYQQRYGVAVVPQRILITPGGSGALLLVSALLLNAGQSWLAADPGYPCNRNFLRLLGAHLKAVPAGPEVRYQLSAQAVDTYWDASCVGALVASPANPTGMLLNRETLTALAAALRARGGHLVADEIYHGLTYGVDAVSALQVEPEAYVLNSFSKYFGMTGWRVGWLVAPEAAIAPLERLAQNLYICAPTLAQHAALACFEPEAEVIFEARRQELAARRDYLVGALRALGFGVPLVPEGAFYVYADASTWTDDAMAFCRYFLEESHLAFTPGLDFGQYRAHQHVRFAYTQPLPRLRVAMERLEQGLSTWRQAGA